MGLALLPAAAWAAGVRYPDVTPNAKLVFPHDHGAHPEFRIEWWYITGWLENSLGFQITFFRARPEEQSANPSRFNPKQVLFAHAALSDPARGRLLHDQRAARAGFSLATWARRSRVSRPAFTPSLSAIGSSASTRDGKPLIVVQTFPVSMLSRVRVCATWSLPSVSMAPSARSRHIGS